MRSPCSPLNPLSSSPSVTFIMRSVIGPPSRLFWLNFKLLCCSNNCVWSYSLSVIFTLQICYCFYNICFFIKRELYHVIRALQKGSPISSHLQSPKTCTYIYVYIDMYPYWANTNDCDIWMKIAQRNKLIEKSR